MAIDMVGFADGPPRALATWAVELAASIDQDELVARTVRWATASQYADRQRDPAFLEKFRASSTEKTRFFWEYLKGTIDLETVALERSLEFARAQARLGIPQSALHSAYHPAYQQTWREWTALLRQRSQDLGLDQFELVEAIEASTERMLLYWSTTVDIIAQAYAEIDQTMRSTGQLVRLHTVRDLLRGETPGSLDSLYRVLGYDLSWAHLAVRLYLDDERKVTTIASELRKAGDAPGVLAAQLSVDEAVVWLGRPRGWPAEQLHAIRRSCADQGVTADLSLPAESLDGFRDAYAQLAETHRIRSLWPAGAPAVLGFEECQLDALALLDLGAARAFVGRTLGALAADTTTAAKLRETLAASFLHGSHVTTASHLGLHEQTVRNRLARARQILGAEALNQPVEIQMALRLYRLTGA